VTLANIGETQKDAEHEKQKPRALALLHTASIVTITLLLFVPAFSFLF